MPIRIGFLRTTSPQVTRLQDEVIPYLGPQRVIERGCLLRHTVAEQPPGQNDNVNRERKGQGNGAGPYPA